MTLRVTVDLPSVAFCHSSTAARISSILDVCNCMIWINDISPSRCIAPEFIRRTLPSVSTDAVGVRYRGKTAQPRTNANYSIACQVGRVPIGRYGGADGSVLRS